MAHGPFAFCDPPCSYHLTSSLTPLVRWPALRTRTCAATLAPSSSLSDPEIYEISGYPAVVKQNGPHESYQLAPRAPIFRREAGKVHDLDSMRTFMRLNRYSVATPDPLFPNPDSAIAARADLLPTTGPNSDSRGPRPAGAIDSKIVSGALADKMQVTAVSGPASVADSGTQPQFEWTGPWANFTGYPHVGHPVTWDFDWVTFSSA